MHRSALVILAGSLMAANFALTSLPAAYAGAPPALSEAAPPAPSEAAPPAVEAAARGEAAAPGPQEVVIGAYINDIQELDFRTHSYAVDLYIWFRWRDKSIDPSKSLEFMNRFAPDDHVRDAIYEEPKELPDGSFYSIVRNQGRFASKMLLADYPFDRQRLTIEVEDNASGTENQVYVPDANPITLSPSITLPGLKIGEPKLLVRENQYPTNFGDPTVADAEAYSRATLIVPVERPLTALSVKTFLPILLILVCAGLVLFIRPQFIDARVGLAITALLTLVALQLAGGSGLPEVDYLTMVDKVYLASYAFIMFVLLRVVRSSWMTEDGETTAAVARRDRAWFAVIAVAYIVAMVVIAAGTFKI